MYSVIGQDYPHIEYMVIDGGSTDGSLALIQRHADSLAFWVSEKDFGQADAINKGFARATGDIIAWLNSDDYYLPGAVSAAVRMFEQHPRVQLVYGNMLAVDQSGTVFNTLSYPQCSVRDLLCFQIIGQPAVFMRSSALRAVGGLDASYHFLLDHHLWLRLAARGEMLHVDQTWAAARYHPAAKNRAQAAQFGREAFRILNFAASDTTLSPLLQPVRRRALASANRVDARYLLDGGRSFSALVAWLRALFIYPPVALARLNILASSLLNLLGLRALRALVLRLRAAHHQAH